MLNQYYNLELQILLCRCRQVAVGTDWSAAQSFSSDFWRLYYHPDDEVVLKNSTAVLTIPPGQVVLIPPHTVFQHAMTQDFKQFYVHFLVNSFWHTYHPGIFPLELDDSEMMILKKLVAETEKLQANPPSRSFSLRLWSFCGLMLSYFPEASYQQKKLDAAIRRAVQFMEQNLDQSITNADLAQKANLAVNYFIKVFQQQMGVTPRSYLKSKRVEQAEILLRYSDQSIDEIAAACGFLNRYHFSRVFKNLKGLAPAQFRKFDFSQTI